MAVPVTQSSGSAWSVRRALLVVLLALLIGMAASHPGRVGIKTLLILPEALPDPPARPLLWVTRQPIREEHAFESAAGHVDVDLYLPAGGGRHGAIVLYTGAFGLRRDLAFVQVAEGLARAGAVVMVPESEALRSGELRPEEVDTLLKAVAFLRARPEVDPARIGIAGFSVGGSLALLAAEDDVGREQIAFLNVFGAYYDAREALRAVASHEIEVDGQRIPWEPMEVSVYIFTRQLIAGLPDPGDRAILERGYLDHQPLEPSDLARLTPEARGVPVLFESPTPEQVDAILDALPRSTQAGLVAISPSARVSRLRTALFIMHGRDDRHIPVTESRRLAAEVGPGVLRRYSEFRLVEHVRVDQQLSAPALAIEVLRLYRHLWQVAQQFL